MQIYKTKLNKLEKKSVDTYSNSSLIYIGKVKDSRSPNRDGSILVWIIGSDTDENDPRNWIVALSSQSFGTHEIKNGNFTSYGFTTIHPNVDDYVFIFYPYNGTYGNSAYWFGTPRNIETTMLPGIAYNLYNNSLESGFKPVTDMFNKQISSEFTPLSSALVKQGLDNDKLRGPSTASAIRDNPTRCYGFVTPLGNQVVIDDGWSTNDNRRDWIIDPRINTSTNENKNKDDYAEEYNSKKWTSELNENGREDKLNRFHGGFRFRTRNGTQLLILDTGNIYMINKDGSAWVELSDDGYIDCYSKTGINANSDGDINLHSNKNINIEAENVYIKGNKHIELETVGNIDLNSSVTRNAKIITSPKIESETCMTLDLESEKATIKEGVFGGTLKGMAEFATTLTPSMQVPQPEPMIDVDMVSVPADIEKKTMPLVVGGSEEETINTRIPTHEPYLGHDKNKFIPDIDILYKLKNEKKDNANLSGEPKISNTIY